MKALAASRDLVAQCGLYCGACRRHLRGKCPGCRENARAGWCKVRSCSLERGYSSCAECAEFPDVRDCPKFHNAVSRVIGFALRSDRPACIAQIKALGLEGHARRMAGLGRHSLRPGRRRGGARPAG